MKNAFTRIGVSIWNSSSLSFKTLKESNFREKIKSVLLNVLDHEGSYINVTYLLGYFMTEVNPIICCIYLCL